MRSRSGGVAAPEEDAMVRRALSSADPEELKRAGNEQYKKGYFDEALRLYDRALALCPDNAACRANRAAALTGLRRFGDAIKECEEAVRIDPSYGRAHQRLASLHIRSINQSPTQSASLLSAWICSSRLTTITAESFCLSRARLISPTIYMVSPPHPQCSELCQPKVAIFSTRAYHKTDMAARGALLPFHYWPGNATRFALQWAQVFLTFFSECLASWHPKGSRLISSGHCFALRASGFPSFGIQNICFFHFYRKHK
jgi:tetratricopeptide (TPR) repeat protein